VVDAYAPHPGRAVDDDESYYGVLEVKDAAVEFTVAMGLRGGVRVLAGAQDCGVEFLPGLLRQGIPDSLGDGTVTELEHTVELARSGGPL
jgi:hypothetical protein